VCVHVSVCVGVGVGVGSFVYARLCVGVVCLCVFLRVCMFALMLAREIHGKQRHKCMRVYVCIYFGVCACLCVRVYVLLYIYVPASIGNIGRKIITNFVSGNSEAVMANSPVRVCVCVCVCVCVRVRVCVCVCDRIRSLKHPESLT
jgi:hypothetical protein